MRLDEHKTADNQKDASIDLKIVSLLNKTKMQTVPFCDSNAVCLTAGTKRVLFDEIRARWNNYAYDSFPGPQPVSIERCHLSALRSEPYWVCEKSDGQRFLFVCTRYENKPYCFVVDRKMDMFLLRFEIVTEAFDGTILDGEIIVNKHTRKHEFLVYDSTMVCGRCTTQLTHSERMRAALEVVRHAKSESFVVRLKTFYPLERIETFVNEIVPRLSYEIDGFVFTPEKDPVISGTHYRMFKWKEQHKNTVDFLVEPNHNKRFRQKYVMKIMKGKSSKALLDNRLVVDPGHEVETEIRRTGAGVVVECAYLGPNVWKALLIRRDKTFPNSYMTWTKTLLNIEENIQLKEFFE